LHALIIANGQLNQQSLPQAELIIAADGGTRHCLAHHLFPTYVIGDLDSLDELDLARLHAAQVKVIQYPPEKDYTDLELALQLAVESGASQITVLAALGERWDQSLANLLLPIRFPQAEIRLLDGPYEIRLLREGGSLTLHGAPQDTVSLIPLTEPAGGISTQGLAYPLRQEDLHLGATRGISNVLLGTEATITLEKGLLLCTHIHSHLPPPANWA